MNATSIDEVIQNLDKIVAQERANRSPVGLFPALYRQVTVKVKQGIADGFFEDGPRMEEFDVIFANRYLAAYETFKAGQEPTRSWQLAFTTAEEANSILLMYLLLGINAHINLDLGIAAAEVAPGDKLPALRGDFNKINELLAGLLNPAQAVINRFSPLFGILDLVGGRTDEAIANFSIDKARDLAWEHAEILAEQTPGQRDKIIRVLDRQVNWFGRLLVDPGGVISTAFLAIAATECKDIPAIIDALGQIS